MPRTVFTTSEEIQTSLYNIIRLNGRIFFQVGKSVTFQVWYVKQIFRNILDVALRFLIIHVMYPFKVLTYTYRRALRYKTNQLS
jgi:hypothetical protein